MHTPESFAHIGDQGLPIYSGTTTTPLPQLRECMALYRAHLAAAGHRWQDDQMALMLPVHVGPTGRRARATPCGPACSSTTGTSRPSSSQLPESYGDHLPRLRVIEENVANLPFEKFCRDQAVFGDAAEVVDRLAAAREEFGLSQIICWFDQGSMLPRARSSAPCAASPKRSCRSSRNTGPRQGPVPSHARRPPGRSSTSRHALDSDSGGKAAWRSTISR